MAAASRPQVDGPKVGGFVLYFALGALAVMLTVATALAHDSWKRKASIPIGMMSLILLLVGVQAAVQSSTSVTASVQTQSATGSPPLVTVMAPPTPPPTVSAPVSNQGSASALSSSVDSRGVSTNPASFRVTATPSSRPTTSLYYLSKLSPVAMEKEGRPGVCTGGCTGFMSGPARMAGQVYPVSYLMGNDGDGRRSTATWNVAKSCVSLDMTVGIDDSTNSRPSVTFIAIKDGAAPVLLAQVALAEPKMVSVNLDGVAQIQIAAYVSGPKASGVRLALGDAQLSCRGGSLDR